MNILLVEDDEFKEERIVNFICEKITSANVDISRSVYSAIQFTKSQIYDFVILDMALPGHDISVGSGPASSLPAGGLHVALELDFAGRKDKIVVVTQYPDIEVDGELIETLSAVEKLQDSISPHIVSTVYYDNKRDDWQKSLLTTLSENK